MVNNNIVITGEGIITAIGNDKESTKDSLLSGKSGVCEMHYLNSVHHELPVGEVNMSNEELEEQLGIDHAKLMSRTSLLGIWAVRQALVDSGIELNRDQKDLRVVLISGTTVGGMDITEKFFDELLESDEHIESLRFHDAGSSTRRIADYFGIFSGFTTISTACSSAANALILGANMIKAGEADIVVAGGTESLSKFHLNGFNSLMILDKEVCKPFDAERAGLNLGEGAAYVVLESEELARERKADVHAYLNGYGNACDAFHQTASSENGEGAYLAMTKALAMANLSPSDIQYVNAHGTGTPNNDASESAALKRVFGDKMPLVSSTKSFTGHTTSASGSIEAVFCIMALNGQFIPGNLGWRNQMPDGITPTLGLSNSHIENVVCNAFGFGGNDSSLILSLKPHTDASPFNKYSDSEIKVLAEVEIIREEDLSEISKFIKPLEARRMGKLMKSSLLSSLKALQIANIDVPDAIITGTAWGCLENSEKLLLQMKEEGEAMLKPTYFMQSTHNTIGSNVAIRTKCHGYNVTYTQGDKSWEWAMKDAILLLKGGFCKNVLVGCHDETTPLYSQLMAKLGYENLPLIHSKVIVLSCGK